jgi:hypothetical protein
MGQSSGVPFKEVAEVPFSRGFTVPQFVIEFMHYTSYFILYDTGCSGNAW